MDVSSKYKRETAAREIKSQMEDGTLNWERRIYLNLPKQEMHENHLLGSVGVKEYEKMKLFNLFEKILK